MEDWGAVRGRLGADASALEQQALEADTHEEMLSLRRFAADIRAVLGEIRSQTKRREDAELDFEREHARCEAAEADRDEWRETARSEMAGRRAAEAKLAEAEEHKERYFKAGLEAQAEVERLREALTGMVEKWGKHCGLCCTFDPEGRVVVTEASCVCESLHKQARAALRGGGK